MSRKKSGNQRRARVTGFTMVELLVVISIIGVLTGLLFPVVMSGRSRSKTSVCLSNQHQIGVAIALYAHDYDDLIPYAPSPITQKLAREDTSPTTVFSELARTLPDLRVALKPYGTTQPVFVCPSDIMDRALVMEGGHKDTWDEECGSSYDYDDRHGLRLRALGGYPEPAKNILISDISAFHGGQPPRGLVNVLCADQHAKTVTWDWRSKAMESDP
jgi:prepilin-type N-terminal cleavage/methylation domain-containing protein